MRCSRLIVYGLLVQAAVSAPAAAADWDGDASRILGAPGFLPYGGELEGAFSYSYSVNAYDVRAEADPGDFGRSYHRQENAFLPALTYGITDDIAVFANLGFGNARNREAGSYERLVFGPVSVPGRNAVGRLGGIAPFPFPRFVRTPYVASYHALGADNPAFGATWRVIDQARAPVSVDITGSYSPDIFRARVAQAGPSGETGSVATGGQAGSAELAVMRTMGRMTLRTYGAFSYEGRRNSFEPANSDLRSAPHASYSAGLQSELRVLPWLAVNAGVSAQQAVRYDRTLLSGHFANTQTIEPAGEISPSVGLVVPVVPGRLVLEAIYQHDFIGNETVAFPSAPPERSFHQQINAYTARVLFTFGGPGPRAVVAAPPVQVPQAFGGDSAYLVFFDWDRADLSARGRQIVAEAAQESTRVKVTTIELNGYTDLSGSAAYNTKLSVRRARSVEAELVRDGVAVRDISVHGYGERNPLVPTAPGVREPQNRRVEIVFR